MWRWHRTKATAPDVPIASALRRVRRDAARHWRTDRIDYQVDRVVSGVESGEDVGRRKPVAGQPRMPPPLPLHLVPRWTRKRTFSDDWLGLVVLGVAMLIGIPFYVISLRRWSMDSAIRSPWEVGTLIATLSVTIAAAMVSVIGLRRCPDSIANLITLLASGVYAGCACLLFLQV